MRYRKLTWFIGFTLLVTMVVVSCRQQTPASSYSGSPDERRSMTLLEKAETTGRLTDAEFAEVVQLTQHTNVIVSANAYTALWFVKDPKQKERAAELFREAMKHPEPLVRVSACKGIGFVGTTNDVPLLLPRLQDPDPSVRLVTLQSLQRLGEPAQKEPVRTMLQDPDPEVRQLAEKILTEWEAKSQGR
ncbi:MAG: hypothetical protein CFK49_01505 [Armatimonadetes bacterium JP3_11]|nr:MAG: hypothetical protein CFK48_04280 [Armatimonadetes bacterium CP1_7O]OYT75762.1 MAG: hypothetical protein CFK49_01505 [Armatimonadetes bacterium JP3_11]RMH09399.1 MAG: HEAT repeat domain-containing protein [Armatimonadota bacterium]